MAKKTNFSVPMEFDGFRITVTLEDSSFEDMLLTLREAKGHGWQPVRYTPKNDKPAPREYVGDITDKKQSEKTWNNKPMIDYTVRDAAGQTEVITTFTNEFRKGDLVRRYTTEKGYPALEMLPDQNTKPMPF